MAQKPVFVLHGRIVTMTAEDNIVDNGYLAIKDGRIAAIASNLGDLPPEYADKAVIETGGTIYPGLIDLHNHFVYNVLPLWVVPRKYNNRSQWPAHAEYKSEVSKPIRNVLAKYSVSAKALVRYVEAKAILGGTTTGQGMRTRVYGGSKIFDGAMRNVEEPGDPSLPPVGTMVPDLIVTGATAQEKIETFRRALNMKARSAYFYHLSEGNDERSRRHFLNLVDNDLINEKLVGIHSLGLQKQDMEHLADKGAKVVWSPFSNQLLYGSTLNLRDLKSSKVKFSLGCDWSPSGSKNILQELKVAWHANEEQGGIFTTYELVKSVTSGAAEVTGWQAHVGMLEQNKLADIVVVKGTSSDSYMHLIKALEKHIDLVVVDGMPRYGRNDLMKAVHNEMPMEDITIAEEKKSLYLFSENSEINDIGLNYAIRTLEEIMKDLPAFVTRMEEEEAALMSEGVVPVQEFAVELDNEFQLEADVLQEYETENEAELVADPPMATSIELDSPVVEGEHYWKRINSQKNISDSLKNWLRECYNQ